MSSPGEDAAAIADIGLLTPVAAGTAAERLTGDQAIVDAMICVEAALVRVLVRAGIAPDTAAPVADTIAATTIEPRTLAVAAPTGGNPTIPLVAQLRSIVPADQAEWVHHGATSQDVLDTALMLVARDVLRQVDTDLGRLAATLAGLARAGRDVPIVARTLTQQAMPTTLGMRVAGWLEGVHDAVTTVRTSPRLPISLGGPVGTAATYGERGPAVADALAAELDLRAPVLPWHTRRAPVLGLVHALTVTGAAIGKVAADVLVMAQSEVGEVREAEGGGPSSAMAHKVNPTQSVLIAAAARQLPPLASIVMASAVAEQERPAGAWHAEWQPLRLLLRLGAGVVERTAAMVEGLRFNHAAMGRNLERLTTTLGEDDAWVAAQIEHVDAWIDRALARHEELFG